MKHCCHCGLKSQLQKFKAGKLGLLGGFLIIGHLLFHVAECLILPAIIVAFNHHDVEAVEEIPSEVIVAEFLTTPSDDLIALRADFFQTLEYNYPLKR